VPTSSRPDPTDPDWVLPMTAQDGLTLRAPPPAGAPACAQGSSQLPAYPRPAGALGGTAITYGTYDLFHIGHVRLFERIRQRWGRLVVAVSTDEFNALKGKRAIVPYEDRRDMVAACRWVDRVIPEDSWAQKARDIRTQRAEALVMGSDWAGRFDEFKPLCEVVYLPRTEGISSTALKADVLARVRTLA
jgi:glycerol-3-phosphate cytidylyltransferase